MINFLLNNSKCFPKSSSSLTEGFLGNFCFKYLKKKSQNTKHELRQLKVDAEPMGIFYAIVNDLKCGKAFKDPAWVAEELKRVQGMLDNKPNNAMKIPDTILQKAVKGLQIYLGYLKFLSVIILLLHFSLFVCIEHCPCKLNVGINEHFSNTCIFTFFYQVSYFDFCYLIESFFCFLFAFLW